MNRSYQHAETPSPPTGETRRAEPRSIGARFTMAAGLLAYALFCLSAGTAAASEEERTLVGHRYPSERSVYTDEQTGREVVRLTTSPASDNKIYQTHPSWTADRQWIVFSSDRTGSAQLFAVHERRGDFVQLTDEPGVSTAQVSLSHRRAALITIVAREVVLLDLEPLLDATSSPAERAAARRVVGRLPEGAKLSGTISWDASEDTLWLGLARPALPESQRWSIEGLELRTGKLRQMVELGFRVGHVQANPWRAGLVAFCHETGGDAPQRMWVVDMSNARDNGSGRDSRTPPVPRPFYSETFDEWVTHEVWLDPHRALFTVWPKNDAMRAKPHGIVSVTLAGEAKFHSRFPYWHVTGARGCRYAVGDTFSGEIYRVDLETGERILLTQGHRIDRKGAHPHQRLRSDGKVVVFNSNAAGNADLYLVEIAPKVSPDPSADREGTD